MKRTSNPHAEAQLTELATQFDHWRRTRTSRAERIPLVLWEQAVALTPMLSLAQVAKTLRVSWRDLQQHCVTHAASGAGHHPPDAPAQSGDPRAMPQVLLSPVGWFFRPDP
jgi:hypothetical protein